MLTHPSIDPAAIIAGLEAVAVDRLDKMQIVVTANPSDSSLSLSPRRSRRESALRIFFACLLLFACPGLALSRAEQSPEPLTCESLSQKFADAPWLSLPESRIVVNPFTQDAPPLPDELGPTLPVSLGYYAGEFPSRLPWLWSWQWTSAASPLAVSVREFCPLIPAEWRSDGALLSVSGRSGMRALLASAQGYGSATLPQTFDPSRTPFLRIDVPAVTGRWALKIGRADAPVDRPEEFYLQHDTGQTGAFIYDLRGALGKAGDREGRFYLRLFTVGTAGQSAVTVTRLIRFGAETDKETLRQKGDFIWQPQQIMSEAKTESGSVAVRSRIAFIDRDTVVQTVSLPSAVPSGHLFLLGQWRGSVSWDAAERSLLLSAPTFTARVQIDHPDVRWVGVFNSWPDWIARRSAGKAAAGLKVWAVELTGVSGGEDLSVIARLMPGAKAGRPAAFPAVCTDPIEQAVALREAEWDRRLATVPVPASFALHHVRSEHTTPEMLRRTYGRAWVFLMSGVLPPMPENGYRYPQAACGKPSLWGEGAPQARASAQWESFIAIQYLARVEPETAWRAFEGLMAIVPPDGVMPGEGLPAVHSQTAWILYRRTGDLRRLAKVYPAIKRLLLWKIADPRWIHRGETPPDTCDAEFVVHALYDMGYIRRIAEALGMKQDVAAWQERMRTLDADYLRWFWATPDGHPYQIYREATGERLAESSTWSLQGLALGDDLLPAANRDSLLSFYRSVRKRDLPFVVPGLTRFPNHSFLIWGLQRYGLTGDAAQLAESDLRDIARAGDFAEDYEQSDPPRPAGVRPSTFGAASVIHAALWLNGVDLLEGEVPPPPP